MRCFIFKAPAFSGGMFSGRSPWVALVVTALWTAGGSVAQDAPPSVDPTVRQRWQTLAAEVAQHDERYFQQAAPVISDAEYDRLKAELRRLEAAHPGLGSAGAGVGDDRIPGFAKAEHLTPMRSLVKAHGREAVATFDAAVRRTVDATGAPRSGYVIEPKYDGVAVSVLFEDGHVVRAVTRGDGREGDDVTENLLAWADLGGGLARHGREGGENPWPGRLELRGEVYVPEAEFNRVNRERREAGEAEFRTARNLAAGTLKSRRLEDGAERGLALVFHGWGAVEPAGVEPESMTQFHAWLRDWGLPAPYAVATADTVDELEARAMAVKDRAEAAGLPVDGVVVKVDAVAVQQALGDGAEGPRWALARKFAPEEAETRMERVVWQVGRTGVLTPVAEFAPVQLGGVTVARASLHHAGEVRRRDLHVGDVVTVARAGEVIPVLVGVDPARRPAGATRLTVPTRCPACATEVVSMGDAVRCPNRGCVDQVIARLTHFAARGAVNVRGLGPRLVERLVRDGGVRSPADLYALTSAEVAGIPGVGPRAAEALTRGLDASRGVALPDLIAGLGLPGVGRSRAEELARAVQRFDGLLVVAETGTEAAAGPPSIWMPAWPEGLRAEVWSTLVDAPMRGEIAGLVAAGINPEVVE